MPAKYCSQSCYHAVAGVIRVNSYARKYKVTDDGRICYHCGEWKTWDNYRKNQTTGLRGRTGTCEDCWDQKHGHYGQHYMFYRYGITPEEYDWLEKMQGGACALCGRSERRKTARTPAGTSKEKSIQRLSVDHDHSCTRHESRPGVYPAGCKECIRGLLCDYCNGRLLPMVEACTPLRVRFDDYLKRRPFVVS